MATKPVIKRKAAVPATIAKSAPVARKPPASKVPPNKPATAGKPVVKVTAKKQKSTGKKHKTIRDSFNMPAGDYALIGTMKKRAIAAGRELKKSELLRAGLKTLAGMTEAAFALAISAVASIKTGRPVKKRK